mmetsp:Transcript_22420/g.36113  ORF Transcript_22420/g.36113 Transcript_22420/m.36113 type:complete len:211 (-) Transcript_22420:1686-2318(-)
MFHDLAFEDPGFDTNDPVSGRGFHVCVIDVGTQCVQWHATFTIPFGTCDLSTTQTTCNVHPDTQGAHAHCVLNGTFHCAAERHTALQLLSDGLANQRRVEFRLAYFNDVEVQLAVCQVRQLLAQTFDVCTFLADDDARTGRVDRDAALFVRTLDDHTGHAGLVALFLDELADFQVFQQKITVILGVGIPAAVPGAVHLKAHANWIDFVTH